MRFDVQRGRLSAPTTSLSRRQVGVDVVDAVHVVVVEVLERPRETAGKPLVTATLLRHTWGNLKSASVRASS